MCFTVALIALLVFSCHVSGQIDAPDKLKAAYILSFAKLVSWPPNILPTKQANLVICAAAAESLTNELRNHSGKTIQGHRVQVIALGKRSDSKGCHIVFIDTRHSSRWFKGANPIEGQLLVGEEEGFIDKGGVINFYIDGEKLRFEISVGHARQSRLDISSRLLNLAKIVGEDGQ
ncbi:hypothetical protein A9Q99_27115 [Gammaproteobacteria bacterium 45_16_T64]|nr:hypothetical protein A9Q99_27115 [Gammaproteobacteria bacterium 45_16_T64]